MAYAQPHAHYLSLFVPALKKHANEVILRPYLGSNTEWGSITFREWEEQLEAARLHWLAVFEEEATQASESDVVGVWLTGRKWIDLLNISGISAAGRVPQLFSTNFSSVIIFDLLKRSGARILVYDSSAFASEVIECVLPKVPAITEEQMKHWVNAAEGKLVFNVKNLVPVKERNPAVIFHSSGTTSGIPKLIPTSHLLLITFMYYKMPHCLLQGEKKEETSVINSLGSLAHVGSFQAFHATAFHGGCTVQASSMALPTDEFLGMIRTCGLNRLVQYATFLSGHIDIARKNEEVKYALQTLRQILHTGVTLNREDEEWARENGLRITTMYGTSETAPLLTSTVGSRLLRPVDGASPKFIPYTQEGSGGATDAVLNGTSLYEIVVEQDAPDAPPASLFSEDGFWHTNDLFEKVQPAYDDPDSVGWLYRGRAGDWIKTLPGFCDTKTIEDNVRKACPDTVYDAVVVGNGCPSPCLVVESIICGLDKEKRDKLAQQIVELTAPLNQRLFHYELVDDPKRILVVDKGMLPRTKEKGNIRRNATEELFKQELDGVFV